MIEQREVALFRNGRNQAIRIPHEFELEGNNALLIKDGNRLIIEPLPKYTQLLNVLESLEPLDAGFPLIEDLPAADEGISLWRSNANGYMLDINIITDLVKNPTGRVYETLKKKLPVPIYTSIIVSAELQYGLQKSGSEKLKKTGQCNFGSH